MRIVNLKPVIGSTSTKSEKISKFRRLRPSRMDHMQELIQFSPRAAAYVDGYGLT